MRQGINLRALWVQGFERELLFRDDILIDRIGGKEFKAARVSYRVFFGNILVGESS